MSDTKDQKEVKPEPVKAKPEIEEQEDNTPEDADGYDKESSSFKCSECHVVISQEVFDKNGGLCDECVSDSKDILEEMGGDIPK